MSDFNNHQGQSSGGYQSHGQYEHRPKQQWQQNQPGKDNFFGGNSGGGNGNRSYDNRGGGGGNRFNRGGGRQSEENFDESKVRLYKAYACTGNREAPPDVLNRLKELARDLEEFGYTLRVGGMDGPEDSAKQMVKDVEYHVPFLPWKDFDKYSVKSYFNTKEIQCLAKMFHPTYDGLKPAIQAFLSKNVRVLLGKDLKSPVRFVVGWSEDGAELSNERTARTGTFGHVVSIAAAMKIPVFNFGKPDAELRLRHFLEIPDNGKRQQFTEF